MKFMSGEIGKLSLNDKQVGGFKYWTTVIKGGQTRVIASQYWMFEKVDTSELEAEFYTEIDGNLKLIHKVNANVEIPECELDKLTTSPIEFDLGAMDWNALER